jgi:hypothetical protein
MEPKAVIDEGIHRLVNGGASEIWVPVTDKTAKTQVVGRAFYWATKAGVAIKTKWDKELKVVMIWRI